MKSLLVELKPALRHMALFSFVMNLLLLTPALFMLQVFDRVIPSNSIETLIVLLAGVGAALAILLVLDFVRLRLQHYTGNLIDERLSPPIVQAVVAATARAPLATRSDAVRDVATLRSLFAANGINALLDAPWLIVYVAVIWLFHPALGWGASAAAVLMLLLAWLNDRMGRTALDKVQQEGRRASRYVEGSLRNAEVLQAMGMTQRMLKRWRALQDEVLNLQTEASRSSNVFGALTKLLRQAVQVAMMALGAYLVLTQAASAGVMIATTVLLGRALQPVEQVVGSWRVLNDARAAYRRLQALAQHFETDTPRVSLPRPEGKIDVDNLSFRPPGSDRMVLTGIAFALNPGEAMALIGPSAAGKSTLARLLTGVWAPTLGKVRLDGFDVSQWSRDELGPWVGYVPQDVELFDGTVGREHRPPERPGPEGDHHGGEARECARDDRETAPGLRHTHRRAGSAPVAWAAPACGTGARHVRRRAPGRARRAERQPRRGWRDGFGAGTERLARRGRDVDRRDAPAFTDCACRQNPRAR